MYLYLDGLVGSVVPKNGVDVLLGDKLVLAGSVKTVMQKWKYKTTINWSNGIELFLT